MLFLSKNPIDVENCIVNLFYSFLNSIVGIFVIKFKLILSSDATSHSQWITIICVQIRTRKEYQSDESASTLMDRGWGPGRFYEDKNSVFNLTEKIKML